MKQSFTIHDRLPGMNEYTAQQRSNRYGGAMMKKYAQKNVEAEIRAAKLKRVERPAYIRYTFYEPNRRRDKDNIAGFAHKIIQDALVSTRILKDDGWDYITGFSDEFHVDKKQPRVEVTLIY